MSKAIEKMKRIINKMPKCKEKQQATQAIKNLEIFEVIANSFEIIITKGKR